MSQPRHLTDAVPAMTMRGSMGAGLLRIQSQLVRRLELPPGPQPGGAESLDDRSRGGGGERKGHRIRLVCLLLIEVFSVCLPLYV